MKEKETEIENNVKTNVLVTGASGFLALHCVKQLLHEGYTVRGTVRSLSSQDKIRSVNHLDKYGRLELIEADLTDAYSWTDAIRGVDYVLHMASPGQPSIDNTEDESIIETAITGILNVFKAAALPESRVKCVVLTSSISTITEGPTSSADHDPEHIFNEKDWTRIDDLSNVSNYNISKVRAERAAWDFQRQNKGHRFELAVVNPACVTGPLLSTNGHTVIAQVVKQLLTKGYPAVPHISIPTIDVRDVARAHLAAMRLPEATNHRHILATQPSYWMTDMARDLENEFKKFGYPVVTWHAPRFIMFFIKFFRNDLKSVYSKLDCEIKLDTTRMTDILNMAEMVPKEQSLIEMAHSMIQNGIIERKPNYCKE